MTKKRFCYNCGGVIWREYYIVYQMSSNTDWSNRAVSVGGVRYYCELCFEKMEKTPKRINTT